VTSICGLRDFQDLDSDWQGLQRIGYSGFAVMDRKGFEPTPETLEKRGVCGSGAAESGAVSSRMDLDLARIIKAWPLLSEPVRKAMLHLASEADDE